MARQEILEAIDNDGEEAAFVFFEPVLQIDVDEKPMMKEENMPALDEAARLCDLQGSYPA